MRSVTFSSVGSVDGQEGGHQADDENLLNFEKEVKSVSCFKCQSTRPLSDVMVITVIGCGQRISVRFSSFAAVLDSSSYLVHVRCGDVSDAEDRLLLFVPATRVVVK